jgi:hypothetical protein
MRFPEIEDKVMRSRLWRRVMVRLFAQLDGKPLD